MSIARLKEGSDSSRRGPMDRRGNELPNIAIRATADSTVQWNASPPPVMASVEQNFSAALSTWKSTCVMINISITYHDRIAINLLELQKTLDTQGVELVENQKESVVGRKALADRTKGVTSSLSLWSVCSPRSQTLRRYLRKRS